MNVKITQRAAGMNQEQRKHFHQYHVASTRFRSQTMSKENIQIPQGWFMTAEGTLQAKSTLSDIKQEKWKVAKSIINEVTKLEEQMQKARGLIDAKLDNYQDYFFKVNDETKKLGGKDGGFHIETPDGLMKIKRTVGGTLRFTEELLVAEQIIYEFVQKQHGSKVLKEIAYKAFRKRNDHYDPISLADFFKADYDDAGYKKAKLIYQKSRYYSGKKPYLTFQIRENLEDEFKTISLNMAQIEGKEPDSPTNKGT